MNAGMWAWNLIGYLRFFGQLLNGDRFAGERTIATRRERDLAPHLVARQNLRVLDLANGNLRPQYELLKFAGHCVVGIDLANRPRTGLSAQAYKLARWLYGRSLPRMQTQRLVCGDVGALPFPNDHFDFVTSVAAFEHFLHVPQVVAELERVVKPGGVMWVGIHPFTGPSGGHNLGFVEIPLRHMPRGVDPWDHLRKRRLPLTVPLNKWRLHQYRAEFARHFQIVKEYCVTREGGLLLTPALQAELAAYDSDELTCAAYVIVARKTAKE